MTRTTQIVAAYVVLVSFLAPSIALALDGKEAAYFGGTSAVFAGAKDPVEGTLDTTATDALTLTGKSKPFKGQQLRIPYESIVDLEYGQKAGRRVGLATGLAVISVVGALALFSKKRKHFLTIGYMDGGTEQVAVLELGKDIVRLTLPIVEARSGKSIEYQDDEAKKHRD